MPECLLIGGPRHGRRMTFAIPPLRIACSTLHSPLVIDAETAILQYQEAMQRGEDGWTPGIRHERVWYVPAGVEYEGTQFYVLE